VDSTVGFKAGQTYTYHDVQPGDTVTVQHHLSLVRVATRAYTLRTNTDVTVAAPQKATVRYVARSGQTKAAEAGRIRRADLARGGETTVTLVK
jgi:hypothetical protein